MNLLEENDWENKLKMNVLVTGGAGFIGSHLVKKLVKFGITVRVLDNLSTGNLNNLKEVKDKIELLNGDITNVEDVEKAVIGIDVIFHLAAIVSVQKSIEDPSFTMKVNAEGTLNLLNASIKAGVKKFINSSTAAVYGDNQNLPLKETEELSPLSPYGESKALSEKYCIEFSQKYNIDTINLRYFNVYGPNQDPKSIYSGVISKFIYAIKNNKSPIIYGDGKQTRDFIYVEDVVTANILAMKTENLNGNCVNIANGIENNLIQITDIINKVLKKNSKPIYKSKKEGDIVKSYADINKITSFLNFTSKFSFEEGIKQLIYEDNN